MDIRQAVETAVSPPGSVSDIIPLSGGCIGQVYRVTLADGRQLVAKADSGRKPRLDIEGYMLRYLADHSQLPVPAVWYSSPQLLLLDFLAGDSHFSAAAQRHAAELLAALHEVTAPVYGLERDTLIGGLHQPNSPADSWLTFFREQRLLYMGRMAAENGRLPHAVWQRIRHFADHLDRWLLEPERPSLLHGDVWTTNVLAHGDRITAFLDPAIYYGHPEIELAFTTLFGTFGQPFFDHYRRLRPLAPGFFEERRDIYNLYPLLVHVQLFGGGYVGSVDRILARFGY
jgi:fructosamine-3-kinase